jgi:hypothetical protein
MSRILRRRVCRHILWVPAAFLACCSASSAAVAPSVTASPFVFAGKPECTHNNSVYAYPWLIMKSSMSGCYRSNLTVSATLEDVSTGKEVTSRSNSCSNTTSCPLPDFYYAAPVGLYQAIVEGCSSAFSQCDYVVVNIEATGPMVALP